MIMSSRVLKNCSFLFGLVGFLVLDCGCDSFHSVQIAPHSAIASTNEIQSVYVEKFTGYLKIYYRVVDFEDNQQLSLMHSYFQNNSESIPIGDFSHVLSTNNSFCSISIPFHEVEKRLGFPCHLYLHFEDCSNNKDISFEIPDFK